MLLSPFANAMAVESRSLSTTAILCDIEHIVPGRIIALLDGQIRPNTNSVPDS